MSYLTAWGLMPESQEKGNEKCKHVLVCPNSASFHSENDLKSKNVRVKLFEPGMLIQKENLKSEARQILACFLVLPNSGS